MISIFIMLPVLLVSDIHNANMAHFHSTVVGARGFLRVDIALLNYCGRQDMGLGLLLRKK